MMARTMGLIDTLSLWAEEKNQIVVIKRRLKLTRPAHRTIRTAEPEPGDPPRRDRGDLNVMFAIVQVVALIFVLISLKLEYTEREWRLGLVLSLILFVVLAAEFLSYRPLISEILDQTPDDAISWIRQDYVTSLVGWDTGNQIGDWHTLSATESKNASDLRSSLFSRDSLRLYAVVKVLLRALLLMAVYALLLASLDSVLSEDLIQLTVSGAEQSPQYIDYLYQVFSLFIAVSSISVLPSTGWGVAILTVQILLYFFVFTVIVGRVTEGVSVLSARVDDIAHRYLLERSDL